MLLCYFVIQVSLILFLTTEYADDAVGLELVTEPFIENLTKTLLAHFEIEPATVDNSVAASWKREPKADTEGDSKSESKTKKQQSESRSSDAGDKESSPITNFSKSEKLTVEVAPSSSVIKEKQTPAKEVKNTETSDKQSELIMDSTTIASATNADPLEFPVVSSCSSLSSFEKTQLNDLCRRLIEPAQSLKEVLTENLVLPKIVFELEKELNCLFSSVNGVQFNDAKLVSVADLLKSKLPLETTLSEGCVKLTGKLCKYSLFVRLVIFTIFFYYSLTITKESVCSSGENGGRMYSGL